MPRSRDLNEEAEDICEVCGEPVDSCDCDDDLFDADELGLDPEDDDTRY